MERRALAEMLNRVYTNEAEVSLSRTLIATPAAVGPVSRAVKKRSRLRPVARSSGSTHRRMFCSRRIQVRSVANQLYRTSRTCSWRRESQAGSQLGVRGIISAVADRSDVSWNLASRGFERNFPEVCAFPTVRGISRRLGRVSRQCRDLQGVCSLAAATTGST